MQFRKGVNLGEAFETFKLQRKAADKLAENSLSEAYGYLAAASGVFLEKLEAATEEGNDDIPDNVFHGPAAYLGFGRD